MRHHHPVQLVLGSAAALVALALLVWLVAAVLGRTTLTVQGSRGEATAETTLGQLECRKTLKTTFPFIALSCRDEEKR